jgi:hypothetical protein
MRGVDMAEVGQREEMEEVFLVQVIKLDQERLQ